MAGRKAEISSTENITTAEQINAAKFGFMKR